MSRLSALLSTRRTSRVLNRPAASQRSGRQSRDPHARRFSLEPLEDRVLLAVDLAIEKDDGGVRAAPGDTVPYTLTYANRGDMASHGAKLFEVIPAFTSFNRAESTEGWSCSDRAVNAPVCTFDVGPLEAGETSRVVFAVTVNERVPDRLMQIHNTAYIRGTGDDGRDPHPRNNVASDTTPIVHPPAEGPDLKLEMSDGDVRAAPGDTIVYKIGYGNAGPGEATGVLLTDRLPQHTTFSADGSSDGWRCSDRGVCQLEIGTLPANERGMATLAVTVNDELPSRLRAITNVAHIADDGSHGRDPTPRDNHAAEHTPIVNPLPDLRLHKDDGLRKASPGDTLSYHLVFANTGGKAATGVVLTERIPAHTRFDAAASSDGWRCGDDRLCRLEVGELPAGKRDEATFAVRVAEDLPRRFVAIVNVARIHDDGASGRDPTPWNNRAFDVTFVVGGPTPEPRVDVDVNTGRQAAAVARAAADGLRPVDMNHRALAAVTDELIAGGRLTRGLDLLADDVAHGLPSRDYTPASAARSIFDRVDLAGALN